MSRPLEAAPSGSISVADRGGPEVPVYSPNSREFAQQVPRPQFEHQVPPWRCLGVQQLALLSPNPLGPSIQTPSIQTANKPRYVGYLLRICGASLQLRNA